MGRNELVQMTEDTIIQKCVIISALNHERGEAVLRGDMGKFNKYDARIKMEVDKLKKEIRDES